MKFASILMLALLPWHAHAQYQISLWTSDGGGGRCTGSVYAITATLGQPDAGTQTGSSYTLAGGFWGFAGTIETEGLPTLRFENLGTGMLLAWPNPSTGFQLQATPSLTTPLWADVIAIPAVVGAEKQLQVPHGTGASFFRLRRP